MTDATKIHLAERPPVACAACSGQYPDRQHVDFGASFDGPVLNQEQVITLGVTNIQIDDLIVCDECVRAAAALLGLAEHDRMKELLADMHEQLNETGQKLKGALTYIDTLESAAKQRESLMPRPAAARPRAKK